MGRRRLQRLGKCLNPETQYSPSKLEQEYNIYQNSMEQWKENNSYGKRWPVEICFSGLKRVKSDVIKAKKIKYIIPELTLKVINYNIMMGVAYAY